MWPGVAQRVLGVTQHGVYEKLPPSVEREIVYAKNQGLFSLDETPELICAAEVLRNHRPFLRFD